MSSVLRRRFYVVGSTSGFIGSVLSVLSFDEIILYAWNT